MASTNAMDKYNDDQASFIIHAYNGQLKAVVINGVSIIPDNARKSIGSIQMSRVLKFMCDVGISGLPIGEKNFEDIFNNLGDVENVPKAIVQASNGGGTPPKRQQGSNNSTPARVTDDHGNGYSEDFLFFAFSVIKKAPSDNGDEPPDHDDG